MKRILDRTVDFFLALLLLAMTFVVFTQVFFRYVFNAPLSWPEEIARMMIVWLSFIGAYMAMREDKHIGFSLLLDRLPAKNRAIMNVVTRGLVIVFLAVMVKQGWIFAQRSVAVSMPYTGISVGWVVYSIFPVSGALMFLQSVIDLSKDFARIRATDSPPAKGVTRS